MNLFANLHTRADLCVRVNGPSKGYHIAEGFGPEKCVELVVKMAVFSVEKCL